MTFEPPKEDLPVISHKLPVEPRKFELESVIDAGLPIVDAHHHFSSHWGGYFVDDLDSDMKAGHNVVSTVYVQCGHSYRNSGPEHLKPVGETEFVIAQVEKLGRLDSGIAAGIVGYADLMLGEKVSEVLEAHIGAGRGRFRGIRHAGARHEAFRHGVLARPPAGLFGDVNFRRGYGVLAKFGLVFDAWTYHTQIGEVVSLAQAFPETVVVVDHVAGVLGVGPYTDNQARAFEEWKPGISALAACPNVRMKLGGFGTGTFGFDFSQLPRLPNSEELAAMWRPFIEPCIEAFGAQRCMFESNFPVDRSVGEYPVIWNAFKRIVEFASEDERASLFHGTATDTYSLKSLVQIS